MGYGERIADEVAAHYAALRDRRVPAPLACVMAWRFHDVLTRAVLFDDAFDGAIANMLARPETGEG